MDHLLVVSEDKLDSIWSNNIDFVLLVKKTLLKKYRIGLCIEEQQVGLTKATA